MTATDLNFDQQHASADPLELNSAPSNIDDSQFRLLAENIPTLCWMANADGYIFWYNRRWHEYCGTTPAQMEGWGWQSVHEPDVLPAVLERWTDCIAAGAPFEMIFPLKGADGVFRPFLTRIQPMRDADGTVQKWFGANVDVTAQVEAETELRAANIKKDAIAAEREATLSQLGEGVIVTDATGRITFVNEAASRLHGVARLDIEPEDYTEVYSLWTEDGRRPYPVDQLPLTRAVRHQKTVVDARWKIRRPDGSELLALGNAKPIYDADQSFIGAVLTIRDDTLRHAAEEALAQALHIKDVLLQEVNHRVKNNLQLVTSLLSLQANRTDLPGVRISLLDACSRVGVIAGMHQRLYASTRHESVNLSAYLGELVGDTITALNAEKGIKLHFSSDEDFPVALDDAVAIALIVNELLTNAMKYAFDQADEGEISVTIARKEKHVCITISDDGKGLPEAFDPMASKGLGMLIVTALVGQVGGSMIVIPQKKGSAFQIWLPFERLYNPTKGLKQSGA
jgi:two-component system, sensor histidine kinase PdtaS